MTNRFLYNETVFKGGTDADRFLSIERSDRSAWRLFRLLSGTCSVLDDFRNTKYRFRRNYLNVPSSENGSSVSKSTILNLFSEDLDLAQLTDYFRIPVYNENIYKDIEQELIHCLVANREGRYLESFLFLYRVIEGLSYCLPLMYVSSVKSFRKSYNDLKSFFSKDQNAKETKFLERFVKDVFKDESFALASYDIDFSKIQNVGLRSTYYGIYKDKISNDKVRDFSEDEWISISFMGIYELIFNLRNRYFHFRQGESSGNISTKELQSPDLFFMPILDLGINWIGLVLFEVVKFDLEKHFDRSR